ncbi:sulfatase-like hydrolase/transferase [Marinoscillum sp. MHG1-6]|uniref:sulfatase-like hydrolase/transferase n=1 Tax=Marinoscillum sp. MHG1-6 TaxID=2959627 RepID=UPI0021579F7B|nr:sulfatase-like hydrolase/transferase [Marinoscillum sp. MHG1-6]
MNKKFISGFLIGLCLIMQDLHSQQRNVLFIAVDDLKPMIGAYGDQVIQTPNMDRLAAMGTVFTNASCQQSVCGPSRTSILTGWYPDQTEVYNLSTQMRDKNPDVITLPQHFIANGYFSTGGGKMYDPRNVDNSFDASSWSESYKHTIPLAYHDAVLGRGFQGYHNPAVEPAYQDYEQYLVDNNITSNQEKNEALKLFPDAKPSVENMDVPDDAYKDGAAASFLIKKLDGLTGSSQPFFLSAGFSKPHLPFAAPKAYWDLYDRNSIAVHPEQGQSATIPAFAYDIDGELLSSYSDTPLSGTINEAKQKELIHGYMACVSYVDAQIGKVLDKLDELNLTDNTVIVLWGDHGFHLGDHSQWAKKTNFEQAVRSPLMIYSPDTGLTNNVTDAPVELVDVYPTVCALAGVTPPAGLAGTSLVPLLNDPTASVRFAAMSQYHRDGDKMGYTLRNERYRYTKWIHMDYDNGERIGPVVGHEFYDYQVDEYETVNLYGDSKYDVVIAAMEAEFASRGVAQSAVPPGQDNFLLNPGFEEGILNNWSLNTWGGVVAENGYASQANTYEGDKAYKLDVTTAVNKGKASVESDIYELAMEGKTLNVSVRVKTKDAGMNFRIQAKFYDVNDNTSYRASDVFALPEDTYDEYTYSVDVPTGSTKVAIRFQAGGEVGKYFLDAAYAAIVDNASVRSSSELMQSTSETLSVYPNPANGFVSVKGVDIQSIKMYDLSGSRVNPTFVNNQQLDVSHLKDGIYLLLYQDGEQRRSTKLKVEH